MAGVAQKVNKLSALRKSAIIASALVLCGTALEVSACPFSIDGTNAGRAMTDGVSFSRFTQRTAGSALQANERAVHEHIAKNIKQLDLNADGRYDAHDALIAARAMLGFRDQQLTQGLALTGARNSFAAIQSFIDNGCAADMSSSAGWQSTSFTETDEVIANPERGFWASFGPDFLVVDDGQINWMKTTWPDMTLGYGAARLDAYRSTQTLPQSYLDALTAAFAKVRASGMKVILRFAYNSPAGEPNANIDDAPINIALAHIHQLAPIVQANADVVYVWQAGFIGLWGEGHSSTNDLTSDANKAAIRDALLAVLPSNRFLLWRPPADQILWDAQPGNESDAFGTSRQARMGMYNDCFMASNTDVGTYSSDAGVRATQRAYVAARSAIAPFGGETCNGPVVAEQRLSCTDIRREGPEFHLSYLNRGYYEGFMNRWVADGCFTEVNNKMGHRWVLSRIDVPKIASRGSVASVSLAMKNVGWARLFNARAIQVQLVSRANPSAAPITASAVWDPRWLRANEAANVLFNVEIPAGAPVGVYDVFVASPDASASLANNPAYAVRFANANNAGANQLWSTTRGAFSTGLAISIQ